ncbi:MAG TPA: ABC transporter ATP-binding protein [Candidatus Angelobacter sp.]
MIDEDNNEEGLEEGLDKVYDRRLIARLLKYLFPYKWSVIAALVLSIIDAPLAIAGPLLTKAAIDLFLLPDPSRPPAGYVLWLKQSADLVGLGGSKSQGFIFIAALFLLCNVVQSATQYLHVVIAESAGQKAIYNLRQEIFSHLQKVPIQFYDRTPVGRIMTYITNDVDGLAEIFSSGLIAFLSNIAVALYIVGCMLRIDWSLALMSCATLLAMTGFAAWFRTIARPVSRSFREHVSAMNGFLKEHLTGMQVIQSFNREAEELRRFKHVNDARLRAGMAALLRSALFHPTIAAIASIGIALVLCFGGSQVMRGIISLGTLVAFIQLAQSFYDPIADLHSRYPVLQSALISSERIFSLLDQPVAITPTENPAPLATAHGRIEFRNVWFAYHADDWILKDVSFTVELGQKVAFVGLTGAGKTTITNLLLRFYEIQRGRILLDGVDIRQIDPVQLRSNFALVLQDIVLFSGDITSNVRLGDQSISEERVRTAARAVHLDEFITSLDRGYHSEVLERGAGLSVGQKQLVGFARALAFDRPILVLDEATSSIDSRTESQIRNAIQKTMVGRTALVIAHRLSTIQSVDKILVIHKGEIRECGNHQSLIAQQGLYWRLYRLQFGGKPVRDAEIA